METRDQELSFGTKDGGILFIIDGDISSWSLDKGYISPNSEAFELKILKLRFLKNFPRFD